MEAEENTLIQTIEGTEIDLSEIGSLVPLNILECSNCLQKFVSASDLTRAFLYEVEDEAGTPDTFIEVTIIDALNYILRWRSFGITFQQQSGQTLQFEESDTAFCKTCAGASAKLYTSIRIFDALTQKESRVNQMTNTFLETIVELANANKHKVADPVPATTEAPPTLAHGPPIVKTTSTKFVPYKHDVELGPIETKYTAADVNVPVELPEALSMEEDESTSSILTKSKTGNWVKSFVCDSCGAKFNKKTNLTRHLLLTHEIGAGREKSYKCEECDRSFHFQYMLKSHVKIHSEDRSEQCPKCPMKFKGKDGLFHHIKDVHRPEDEKPRCRLCKTSFKQERSLQEHMLYIHRMGIGGKKPISCTKCGAQFKRKRSMLAHLRNGQCHSKRVLKKKESKSKKAPTEEIIVKKVSISRRESDGDSYPCPFLCGKSFARKSSMMSHITHLCRLKPKEEYEFEDEDEYIVPMTMADLSILKQEKYGSSSKISSGKKKTLPVSTTPPLLENEDGGPTEVLLS